MITGIPYFTLGGTAMKKFKTLALFALIAMLAMAVSACDGCDNNDPPGLSQEAKPRWSAAGSSHPSLSRLSLI